MTFEELILRVRSAWEEERGGDIRSLNTTGVGTTTTFKCTSLVEADDYWIGKEIWFQDLDQRRIIVDWSSSSTEGTLDRELKAATSSAQQFLIGEKGFWSDKEILDWANDGQFDIVRRSTNVSLWDSLGELATLTPASGIAGLPSDFVRFTRNHIHVDGSAAPFMKSYNEFISTIFIDKRAYKMDGDVHYRPTSATTVEAEIIRRPVDIEPTPTGYSVIDLDKQFHDALADYVIMRGFLKLESKSADKYAKLYDDKIKFINATAA